MDEIAGASPTTQEKFTQLVSPRDPVVQPPAHPCSLPAARPLYIRPACGGPPRKKEARAFAAALLCALALLLRLHPHAAPAQAWSGAAAAIALGGCLWWVAQRQTSHAAALLALAFYAAAPPGDPAPALGLFAMVFTATGVAHALQGPRRKWPPRIGLMAAATLFTAMASPPCCAAALVLSLPCALWLAERRRAFLLLCFVPWTSVGLAAAMLLPAAHGSLLSRGSRLASVEHALPLLAALAAAFAFYCARPRSRFYGNTVPLLLTPALLPLGLSVALPFALLFLAGIAADAFAGAAGRVWRGALWACAALQLALFFRP